MKKKFVFSLVLMLVMLSGCGGRSTPADNTISGNATHTEVQTESNVSDTVTERETTTVAPVYQPIVLEVSGVRLTIPEGYVDREIYGKPIFTKETASGKIHLTYNSNVDSELQIDDLRGYLNHLLYYKLYELFDNVSEDSYTMEELSLEDCTVLNAPSTKVSGLLHLSEDDPDMYYIAYYTLTTLDMYGETEIPMCWIVFGDNTPENIAEMEKDIEDFVNQSETY